MTGGRITETYNIAPPRFQTEHGIKACYAVRIAVRDIQVIRAYFYVIFIEITLGIIILEVMEDIEDIIQGRFEFFEDCLSVH
jgi:hypothetical protein